MGSLVLAKIPAALGRGLLGCLWAASWPPCLHRVLLSPGLLPPPLGCFHLVPLPRKGQGWLVLRQSSADAAPAQAGRGEPCLGPCLAAGTRFWGVLRKG